MRGDGYRGVEERRLFTLSSFPRSAQCFLFLLQFSLYFHLQVSVVHVLMRLLDVQRSISSYKPRMMSVIVPPGSKFNHSDNDINHFCRHI